jgi:hypothetical protein
MAEQNAVTIKHIQLGDNLHDINAKYWDGKTIGEKQDTLISGTNIKTIGGVDILGSGNIGLNAFVGTYAQYEELKDKLAIDALVVIIDDNQGSGGSGGNEGDLPETSTTTATLGKAILGKMILGKI